MSESGRFQAFGATVRFTATVARCLQRPSRLSFSKNRDDAGKRRLRGAAAAFRMASSRRSSSWRSRSARVSFVDLRRLVRPRALHSVSEMPSVTLGPSQRLRTPTCLYRGLLASFQPAERSGRSPRCILLECASRPPWLGHRERAYARRARPQFPRGPPLLSIVRMHNRA
jgi:hypothetical protein